MLKILCPLFLFIFLQNAFAQLPVLKWADAFPGNNDQYYLDDLSRGVSIAVDKQGNVYSAGLFTNTVDFDPGAGVYNLLAAGPFAYGVYVSKLSADGKFIWAKQIPVSASYGSIDIALDSKGDVYLATSMNAPADMDPGPGVLTVNPIGPSDAIVMKLTSNGDLAWIKHFGGNAGDIVTSGSSITVDKDDNVIVCGAFNKTVDFDPGPGIFNLTTSLGNLEGVVLKLTTSGDFTWAKKLGNFNDFFFNINIPRVKCDATGNIYCSGNFGGTGDFDPGTGSFVLSAGGPMDGYLLKLDAGGNFIWAKKIGNSSLNHIVSPQGIAFDNQGNVYTAGSFIGTQDFDPGSGIHEATSNNLTLDMFVLKLSAQGDFMWVKNWGGDGSDDGTDLAIDNAGNLYITGYYVGAVDFDPGPGTFIINDMYGEGALVKLDAGGNFVYAAAFRSIGYGDIWATRVVADNSANIYITGYVSGTADFDPGPAQYPISSNGTYNPFVIKLAKCTNITTALIDTIVCNNYTLNDSVYSKSGTYIQTISNYTGCDSIITLHLTVNKKLTEQNKTICEGESFFAGGFNQTAAGVYTDTLVNALGCDSIVSTYLSVNPKPQPNLGPDRNLCLNESVQITPGIFEHYLWQDNSTQPGFTITAKGTFWVKVTNTFNCSASDSLVVMAVHSLPQNFLPADSSVCSYSTVTINPVNTFKSYLWSDNSVNAGITILHPGLYWLQVVDQNNCVGKDSIQVADKNCQVGFYIPTAFTPNNDGKNDLYKPLIFGNVNQYTFTIYNRYGQIMFRTNDVQKGWDGKLAGLNQNGSAFTWICNYRLEGNLTRVEKGSVLLIR